MQQLAELHFDTHAHMKSVIGQDMITDDNVAVTELVKNSLDADASEIVVSFRVADREDEHAEIRILDNGVGMSMEDIERKWLNLAFSSKKNGGSRFYAGSKGIGRFSSDRLGRDLLMYTRRAGARKIIKIVVDWESFEGKSGWNAKLQEIFFDSFELSEREFRRETGIEGFKHGTCLCVKRPHAVWGARKLAGLRRDLQRFMLPSQIDVGAGARLFLEALDYADSEGAGKLRGEVRNQAFERLPFKTSYIDSRIDGKGSRIKTRLYYRGELLVEIVERNRFSKIRGAHIVLFHLNQYHKAFFKHETGIRSDEYGSVFLYLNGFRISPYGDFRNDWLGVDARHAQGNRRRLSVRDIIGRIELVDRAGEDFAVTSDREGIKQNDAFFELRDISDGFFGHVFKILERFVVYGLSWDRSTERHDEIDARLSDHSGDFDSFVTKFALGDNVKESDLVNELAVILLKGTKKSNVVSIKFGDRALDILQSQQTEEVDKFRKKLSQLSSTDGAEILNFNPLEICETLKKSQSRIMNLEEKNSSLTEENSFISKKLEVEEKRRLFAESHMTSSKQKLLEVLHLTTIWSISIEHTLSRVLKRKKKKPNFISDKMLREVDKSHMLIWKLRKLIRIITKANFGMMNDRVDLDVFSYVEQYIEEINDLGPFISNLRIIFKNPGKSRLELSMSAIEVSMLVDNIISNADKNSANRLEVSVGETSDKFWLKFNDNGDGLTNKYSHDMLFEAGITTTGGSGIGLHQARKIAQNLDATISIWNNEGKGATVQLEWEK